MGVMNVLKFSAACFDLLGWPLFALGYPLCSSIWVIETNSISDIRKLVTYWVLFSLISLFDHAFAKLLEWIPFWPYIKLMIICCLVMPHFDGSYYVYKHLCEELNVAQKKIQVVELTEIKNGDGAKRCEGPNVAKEEIKVTKAAQRTFGGTAKWVKRTELNLGETKSTTTCAEEIAERATKVEQKKRTFNNLKAKNNGISASSTVKKPAEQHKSASSNGLEQKNNKSHQKNLKQSGGGMKEWGSWCNICNVSRTSELDMASHLNGRRHFNRMNYNAAV
ncbi:hypothetical protein PVL29_003508 [Vitis rotundifolia]|uniref:HVA22-like protein n=1 Tax=Vitis rotundifolia TaxID=103349 RepID=A0AA39E273_VITRO|nr:hypothetical protein PVL29_003508 [Vitis rotundifolia]